jgi:hypothetical protein
VSNGTSRKDWYSIESGRLAFLDEYGLESPVGMSSDDFDPAKGAVVYLDGYAFPADGSKGKWTRQGDLWTYQTNGRSRDGSFVLKLDFADKTWSFDGKAKHLDQNVGIADRFVRVGLELQGLHRFVNRVEDDGWTRMA